MPKSQTSMSDIVRKQIRSIVGGDEADFRKTLVIYALERLIYRLSISDYRDDFVPKGGMLVRALSPDLRQMSQDLDLTGFVAAEAVRATFAEIMSLSVDDGLVYNTGKIKVVDIMREHPYRGKCVQTAAYLGKTPAKVSIDVGFDTRWQNRPVKSSIRRCLVSSQPSCELIPPPQWSPRSFGLSWPLEASIPE